jgi:hypothetical protein
MRLLLLILVAAAIATVARYFPNESNRVKHSGTGGNIARKASSIESINTILGVGIGSSLEEAHQRLDPLRDPASAQFREKEAKEGEGGEKAYWRLVGTEYSWIMAWANKDGQVVQLSASVRPERPKPFAEVGDLAKASTNLENAATWNVQRPGGLSYNLVARGPHHQANNIYMISTTLDR